MTVAEHGGVMRIAMTRPPANALGAPLVAGLTDAVEAFLASGAKVAVLCSELPGYFAAGADIKHMSTLAEAGFARYRDALRAPLERLAGCGRPSIAAIDGVALGGGLELAMACTLRFATPRSRMGLPEIRLGLIPGAGGTQRLPRLVGRGRALELMLSAREIEGTEASAIGLVDVLVDGDAEQAALAFAEVLARASAPAMAAILECVDAPPADGMAIEGAAVVRVFSAGEGREGLAAFIEKRRPVFA